MSRFESQPTANIVKGEQELFIDHYEELAEIYRAAFASYPWFEDLSRSEIDSRFDIQLNRVGFGVLVSYSHTEELMGAMWYNQTSPAELAREMKRGDELGKLVETVSYYYEGITPIWGRETMVAPRYSGQGVASTMRGAFLEELRQANPDGNFIMTRMRDDNTGIIRTAKRYGYVPTSIEMPSSQDPTVLHRYWTKLVEPAQN